MSTGTSRPKAARADRGPFADADRDAREFGPELANWFRMFWREAVSTTNRLADPSDGLDLQEGAYVLYAERLRGFCHRQQQEIERLHKLADEVSGRDGYRDALRDALDERQVFIRELLPEPLFVGIGQFGPDVSIPLSVPAIWDDTEIVFELRQVHPPSPEHSKGVAEYSVREA